MGSKEGDIILKGIKVNNLKNVDVKIPRGQLIVVTGLSGSGKSSLVFNTIYAEGQRRYVESLSSYARQFFTKINKPIIDIVQGIPPSIAIEQQTSINNPHSTVGTSSEVYEYIKLLFARLGKTYSPKTGDLVKRDSVADVRKYLFSLDKSKKIIILAPIRAKGKELSKTLEMLVSHGFSRLMSKDEIISIQDAQQQKITEKLYLLVDRCTLEDTPENQSRIADSIETAYFHGGGYCEVRIYANDGTVSSVRFSNKFEIDDIVFRKPSANMFTFANSYGACPTCKGTGETMGIDPNLVIPNKKLSVYEGAVACWNGEKMSEFKDMLIENASKLNFNIHQPIEKLTARQYDILWNGNNHFPGINGFFQFVEKNAYKIQYRVLMARYKGKTICPDCNGFRLQKDAFYVKIDNKSIADIVSMPLNELLLFFENLTFSTRAEKQIADFLLTEIKTRLSFLCRLGLSYLNLNRLTSTLSGGEMQRLNIATVLGSNLVGALYILDEPSIGLHSIDTHNLIVLLKHLRDIGNTVLVVEHDEEIIRAADYIIDVGPYSGNLGGEIVFQGSIGHFLNSNKSITTKYLRGEMKIDIPQQRKKGKYKITINKANLNNLKDISVDIPLGVLTVVTGVSGSGKSSLIKGVLYSQLKRYFEDKKSFLRSGNVANMMLSGDLSHIHGVEFVDQHPIGKNSRSNIIIYIGVFEYIRKLFAEQDLSKVRNYKPNYFSLNVQGGRCESCQGAGVIKIKMQFMSDVEICCEDCSGKGYKQEVLNVKIADKNIYDVLQMTVDEAFEFFSRLPLSTMIKNILNGLKSVQQVGLGYIQVGQSLSTLSGGEAQRLKLACYLGRSNESTNMMFIFDEPTTGLHFHDIANLYRTFRLLIEQGHTIVVIEHNLDFIKCADHVIDLGPEGGNAGGNVVFYGTPEKFATCEQSASAKFIAAKLK